MKLHTSFYRDYGGWYFSIQVQNQPDNINQAIKLSAWKMQWSRIQKHTHTWHKANHGFDLNLNWICINYSWIELNRRTYNRRREGTKKKLEFLNPKWEWMSLDRERLIVAAELLKPEPQKWKKRYLSEIESESYSCDKE